MILTTIFKRDIIFSVIIMKKEKLKESDVSLQSDLTATDQSAALQAEETDKKAKKEKPKKIKEVKEKPVKEKKVKEKAVAPSVAEGKVKPEKVKRQKVKYKFSSPSKAEKIGIAVTVATIAVVVGLAIFLSFFLYLVY